MNPSGYSFNEPNVQSSVSPQQTHNEGRRSFIDNKPMIQGLVRSVLKVEKNGEAHLINTGLTDNEGAKQIAQNLFSFYDKDRTGAIDPVKVPLTISQTMPILANTYRVFNSSYNPQKEDVNSFFETLDVDRNRKITLEDMEALCIRYLTGTTQGVGYKFKESRNTSSQQQPRQY